MATDCAATKAATRLGQPVASTKDQKEVNMKTQNGKLLLVMLVVVVWVSGLQLGSAQTFQNVPVNGGASLTQLSTGGTSIWALDTAGQPYIYQAGGFVAAGNVSLAQIAVAGGNSVQVDEVWGLDSSGQIYVGSPSDSGWQFFQVPGLLAQIAVGAGYSKCYPYEVWGISASNQIYRFNHCNQQFEQIPGLLTQLTVGGGAIWGINSSNHIFRFDSPSQTFKQVPGRLIQVTVGVDGVWGINSSGYVYQFDPATQRFVQLPGVLSRIAAGGNGVWGLTARGAIYRFDPSAQRFVSVPGVLAQIAVGYGGGVWGINASRQAYAFHSTGTAHPQDRKGLPEWPPDPCIRQ
jgi:hypothetical protein